MKKCKIIAFAGRARSGKSELAQLLKEKHNAKIITIANYLKYLCCDILQITYDELNKLKNNKTILNLVPDENWVDIINKQTGIDKKIVTDNLDDVIINDIRHMLQFIGTDIIRKYKPMWHVEKMMEDITNGSVSYNLFAVDDVRFPNEKSAIEELGGECFFIVRPSTIKEATNHISEVSLLWKDFPYDKILINDVPIGFLKRNFLRAYKNNFEKLNWIFLSENEQYLCMNLEYGLSHKNEELFNSIKECIMNDTANMWFTPQNDKMAKNLKDEVLGSCYEIGFDNSYMFYNPIIIENFKRFVR